MTGATSAARGDPDNSVRPSWRCDIFVGDAKTPDTSAARGQGAQSEWLARSPPPREALAFRLLLRRSMESSRTFPGRPGSSDPAAVFRRCSVMIKLSLATAACSLLLAGPAAAQTPPVDPNPGAITATGNMDVLAKSPYIFRGIVQESRPELTMWPAGDIGIALHSGDGALKSASINFGVWNSLQTGSSGLDGASASARSTSSPSKRQ
jgi:hypothetical protein